MKSLRFVSAMLLAIVFVSVSGLQPTGRLAAIGQQPPTVPPQPPPVTLKVTVVISRFQADKKVGSLPFVLMVVPGQLVAGQGSQNPPIPLDGDMTSIQMAADVPIPVLAAGGAPNAPSYQYRSVGTNINAVAKIADEGRYNISVNVTDSQIMSDVSKAGAASTASPAAFQSFKSSNRLVLRDGQTVQYTAATDKSSGEVVKLDVTLNVIK